MRLSHTLGIEVDDGAGRGVERPPYNPSRQGEVGPIRRERRGKTTTVVLLSLVSGTFIEFESQHLNRHGPVTAR